MRTQVFGIEILGTISGKFVSLALIDVWRRACRDIIRSTEKDTSAFNTAEHTVFVTELEVEDTSVFGFVLKTFVTAEPSTGTGLSESDSATLALIVAHLSEFLPIVGKYYIKISAGIIAATKIFERK